MINLDLDQANEILEKHVAHPYYVGKQNIEIGIMTHLKEYRGIKVGTRITFGKSERVYTIIGIFKHKLDNNYEYALRRDGADYNEWSALSEYTVVE